MFASLVPGALTFYLSLRWLAGSVRDERARNTQGEKPATPSARPALIKFASSVLKRSFVLKLKKSHSFERVTKNPHFSS